MGTADTSTAEPSKADRATLAQVEGLLSAALFRADCPPAETLLLLDAGILDRSAQSALERHLGTCLACREDFSALAVPALRPDGSFAPEFSLEAGFTELLHAGRRLIRAILEPVMLTPALAYRGALEPNRCRYRAGERELLLAFSPSPSPDGGYELEGQLEPWDSALTSEGEVAPCTVRLLPIAGTVPSQTRAPDAQSTPAREDQVDGLGFFMLERVPAGRYRLELLLPELDIIVEELLIQ